MVIEALYLFDVNEQFIDLIPGEDLLEHGQTQELKKLITVNASALYSEDLEQAVFVGHRDIDDSNVFHQYRVTSFKNNNGIVEIEGVHAFFDDMQAYGFIKDKRPTDATAATALGGILEGSRWQIGVNQCTTSATSNYYYVSRLEAFWDFIEKWQVEYKLRMVYSDGVIIGRYVDIYDQLSADYGKWYEYGDQLLTVEKEEDRQGVYTALIGQGKGEETEAGGFGRRILFSDVEWTIASGDPVDKPLLQDYVELPSATAQYGYSDGTPRIGIVEFEDITDPTLLLESTYNTLLANCRPQVQFKAGVDEKGLSELGETVAIIRDDLDIRYKTRIYKLRRNFLDQMDKEFTFGDKLTTSQGERSVQIKKEINKQQQQTISWLEVVNAAMMSMFWNEDGYNYTFSAVNDYNLPGGFYSFNAPIDMNPTKCIYMGAGMLAIANSKLPDGSWNFRTWGTGDGFTADLINAGTIVGTNMTLSLESGVQTFTNPVNGQTTVLSDGWLRFNYGTASHNFDADIEGMVLSPAETNQSTDRYMKLWIKSEGYSMLDFGLGSDFGYGIRLAKRESWFEILNKDAGSFRLVHGTDPASDRQWNFFDGIYGVFRFGKTRLELNGYDDTDFARLTVRNHNTGAYAFVSAAGFDVSSERDLKESIVPTENSLALLSTLMVYDYTKDGNHEIGIITDESPTQILSTDMTKVSLYSYTSLAVKSIQELAELTYQQEVKLQHHETEIKNLKQELADLKALLTEKGVI